MNNFERKQTKWLYTRKSQGPPEVYSFKLQKFTFNKSILYFGRESTFAISV